MQAVVMVFRATAVVVVCLLLVVLAAVAWFILIPTAILMVIYFLYKIQKPIQVILNQEVERKEKPPL